MGGTGAVAGEGSRSGGPDDLSQGWQRAHGAGVASLEDPAFEVVIAKGDVKLRHLPRYAT